MCIKTHLRGQTEVDLCLCSLRSSLDEKSEGIEGELQRNFPPGRVHVNQMPVRKDPVKKKGPFEIKVITVRTLGMH